VIMVWFPKRKTFFFGTNEELFIVKKWEHNRPQPARGECSIMCMTITQLINPFLGPIWHHLKKVTNFLTDNLIFILDFIKTLKELIFYIFPPNSLELMNMSLNIFKHLVVPLNP
jgi:hypothetical protein